MLDPAILESHLSALSFSDPQGFLVLADWLQAQQDPWGELIALQHAVLTKPVLEPEITALLERHSAAWAGTAHCAWHLGFVRTVTLHPFEPTLAGLIAALNDFFARPVARLCDGVVFAPLPAELRTTRDWGESRSQIIRPYDHCEDLLKLVPERVTRIGFGAWPVSPISAYVAMPSFRELSGWFQRITELSLVGSDSDVKDRFLLPKCTTLALHCADLSWATIESILASELPVLDHLTVSFGGSANCILDSVYPPDDYDEDNPDADRYPATYTAGDLASLEIHGVDSDPNRELGMLGAATNLPALRHLSLAGSVLDEGSLEQLAQAPLIRQLVSLDLSDGGLSDAAVDVLIRQRDRFKHLKTLDLRGNRLSTDIAIRVKAALPKAKVHDQARDRAPAFFMRYVATME